MSSEGEHTLLSF